MKIKGLRNYGWPRLSTLGGKLTKDQYRTLQAFGTVEMSDEDGSAFLGFINHPDGEPLCKEETEEGAG